MKKATCRGDGLNGYSYSTDRGTTKEVYGMALKIKRKADEKQATPQRRLATYHLAACSMTLGVLVVS